MRSALLAMLLVWGMVTAAGADVIAFAPLPMEGRETVLKQFMPMAQYLREKMGLELRFEYSESYAEILEKFQQGKIDVAYLGPLPYVSLRAKYAPAEPIVHFNEPSGAATYTCAIVGMADRSVQLATLKNATVALTQPLSTCGYLSTNGMLRERGSGLARNLYRYLDKHDEVALAVVRGEFEIGGIKTAIGKKYEHLGLMTLAETKPLPGFALVGNGKTLKPEMLEAIRTALTSLEPQGRDKTMLESWGPNIRYGAVGARDGDYESVRLLLGSDPIPEKGNY